MKPSNERVMNGWERNLLGVPIDEAHQLIPGAIVTGMLAWISLWLSKFIGEEILGFDKSTISAVMLAILLGLIIGNVTALPESLYPGFSFAVKKILRLGIILLGIRLTVFDVFKLGAFGVPIVILCILGALIITTQINRRLGLPERLGTLIAVGTAICGVSAIVATAPAIEAEDEEAAYAVAVITVFGLLATILYPYLVNQIYAGEALKAGLFLGTAVHDTSQVVGAAKVYADVFSQNLALDAATVTKLVRNVFMAVVIPFMALNHARRTQGRTGYRRQDQRVINLLPLFVLGFLAMAVLRSVGDAGVQTGGDAFGLWAAQTWSEILSYIRGWAGNFLVVALAGVGLSTSFRTFKGLGIKPFLVGLSAAMAVGAVSVLAIWLLGDLVAF